MKKIISLLFVVVLVCSAFVSCGCEHVWDKGKITTAPTRAASGEKIFTCLECGEIKTETVELVTTVTKAEWNTILDSDNYSVVGNFREEGETEMEEATIKVEGNGGYMKIDSVETYLERKDGKTYAIVNMMGTYYGTEAGDMKLTLGELALEKMFDDFDKFTYDEQEKAYVLVDEDNGSKSYIYLDDGVLTKIITADSDNYKTFTPADVDNSSFAVSIMTFTDMGSTNVEVPEYTSTSDLLG